MLDIQLPQSPVMSDSPTEKKQEKAYRRQSAIKILSPPSCSEAVRNGCKNILV